MLFGSSSETQKPEVTTAGSSQIIFDVGIEDFEEKVIRASMEIPIIIDFWAPWCGPCKQLMPTLEKVVTAGNGQVLLAKVNLDDNQQLAAALRVQSVPTVFGFFQGQPVDAFMGAQPESKIREFVQKLITVANNAKPDALDIAEALKTAAELLSQDDIQNAHGIYTQILQQDALNAEAFSGIIRCFIKIEQFEQVEALIQNVPPEIEKTSVFEQAKTAFEMAQMKPSGSVEELEATIAKDENNHQAYIDLAMAQFAAGKKSEATETLLKSIEKDREWNDGTARKELLKLFEAIGQSDPITLAARRKLSSILFS